MQNWDAMQPTANYEQHNAWYSSMFAANIKTEPGTVSPTNSSPMQSPSGGAGPTAGLSTPTANTTASQLESYLKQHQQQLSAMDTMAAMTPSPSNNDSMQHFFDTNMQQQLLQQQQYQQQFQQAQQAAAANQANAGHLPLGFNPLTPPGLPNAVLPPQMSHFYNHNSLRASQQTPSPQPGTAAAVAAAALGEDKLQANALTPRNTPPMDVTPPKSPKMPVAGGNEHEKEHDLISNSSEDMKYMVESEDDESIRVPIFNSHGKMKNYKCKTCGLVAITKVAFWEHTRSHMKPEKILQCPKCPFVTELKHHLEYHTRKHKNLKPFQCDKCSYTCVNKSMLNSHRKSHSSVYQYRCADCDYATKYCHSFKLHLRKYEHKPGMVLDEEGIPNPSVVIDVYGTRRGPKSKSGTSTKRERSSASGHRHHHHHHQHQQQQQQQQHHQEQKPLLSNSQLSAALQGFHMPQHQMPASPAKSTSSVASDLPTMSLNMSMQQQQQQQSKLEQQQQQSSQQQSSSAMPNLLPPLASILQQNHNMAFLPYWNLNLHMLAAQQQAVLAQLSPRMRETAMQQLQNQQQQHQQQHHHDKHDGSESAHEEDDDEDEEFDRKSIDSAMDLSQGTPTKDGDDKQQTPETAMNLKLKEETNDTPLLSSMNASRRKGRVLKLDTMLQGKSLSQSPESALKESALMEMPTASSPIANNGSQSAAKMSDEHSSADESMDATPSAAAVSSNGSGAVVSSPTNGANTSASSTASSSGNSSNSSSSSTSSPAGAIYECKYCDIYFKDAVLYTIHMGYHSCDDVFKCNMCGEKCDGPVGLFVHMARNAHS